jgi:hypothetical protein
MTIDESLANSPSSPILPKVSSRLVTVDEDRSTHFLGWASAGRAKSTGELPSFRFFRRGIRWWVGGVEVEGWRNIWVVDIRSNLSLVVAINLESWFSGRCSIAHLYSEVCGRYKRSERNSNEPNDLRTATEEPSKNTATTLNLYHEHHLQDVITSSDSSQRKSAEHCDVERPPRPRQIEAKLARRCGHHCELAK